MLPKRFVTLLIHFPSLCEQGKEVSFLFLLDPSFLNTNKIQNNGATKEVFHFSNNYKQLKELGYITYFLSKTNPIKRKFQHNLESIIIKSHFSLGKPLPTKLNWPYLLRIYKQAIFNYQPEHTVEGINKSIIIHTKKSKHKAWEDVLLNKADTYDIDSTHLQLIEKPYISEWAEILIREHLKTIQL